MSVAGAVDRDLPDNDVLTATRANNELYNALYAKLRKNFSNEASCKQTLERKACGRSCTASPTTPSIGSSCRARPTVARRWCSYRLKLLRDRYRYRTVRDLFTSYTCGPLKRVRNCYSRMVCVSTASSSTNVVQRTAVNTNLQNKKMYLHVFVYYVLTS